MVNPLCVTAFFDGRRGHEKQTRAVLQALERFTPLSVTVRNVEPGNFFQAAGNWARYGLRRIRPLKRVPSSVDLIIGAGSYTHIPMLLLKEETGARAVTCMTPERLFLRRFDLCLIPRHDRPEGSDNIFLTLGPPCIRPAPKVRDLANGLILVGGRDPKSHWWSSQTTMDQIGSILAADPLIHWTITSSPRTPADMLVMLTQLAEENPAVSFFKSEDTHLGWLEDRYAQTWRVWVTADSMSMIYEAVSAGCRVGILPVLWKKKRNKFQTSLEFLIENRYSMSYEMWRSGADEFNPAPLDEASRCAQEILRRWWPERLP
ncbi:MAG: ELM1/GtrOC1 family putative glycosyltransferase [Desulfobacterales bacterium]|jgi:mitochondrial fission protein ELM1|nr:ELM1/GtrOC1 family putative glycosyltransferase [Desulfobacterales bacterium]MDD3081107.1 ELM1/GtrOC1 family putative glycosyltransferase [Desulfobacterales bacterium]MDD3950202.1 ELM1/GtrOC1 family putative glycosyltransferase [Desulfobacterales bacterium]MDY0378437.1 ELM1/GtrOC1 family putative glycosyltransferase [Desulfobacterales bacterium]